MDNLAKCKRKLQDILEEHNCQIIAADEWTQTLIRDRATQDTDSI